MSFLKIPQKTPLLMKPVIFIAEALVGKPLPLARYLSLRPMLALVSALLELAVERAVKKLPRRLGSIVRLTASFRAACPFCVDLNSAGHEKNSLGLDEIAALQQACSAVGDLSDFTWPPLSGFTLKEKAAWAYSLSASSSPLYFPPEILAQVKKYFSPGQIVVLAVTSVKVNYWARLSQALGVPALGVSDFCYIPAKDSSRNH
ncbi:MAG: hypothetical protein JXR70_07210 [Spirochaetales bacterium]|nr:hypothetical protein [Spirochaetales bacterium]